MTAAKQDEKQLLKRCRDILRRYTSEEQALSDANNKRTIKFVHKYAVPAMVADKVIEALQRASAALDSITLSMIMDAYLSCGQPDEAIRAFELAVGYNGNGSILRPRSLFEHEASSAGGQIKA